MTSELRPCCDDPDIHLIVDMDGYYEGSAYLKCFNCDLESEIANTKNFKDFKLTGLKDVINEWDRSLEQEG